MPFVREFEFFESEGCILALPCDMAGCTLGSTMDEAVWMAADWLRLKAEDSLMRERPLEGGRTGHEPQHGGKVIAVAVDVDLSRVPSMTATDAATALGVSQARVAQLCKSGALESWKVGATRMVSIASVEARLADTPKAGRPAREAVMA